MIQPPCKGCTERHQACWSDCACYKLWKAEKDGILADLKKRNPADAYLHDNYSKRGEPFRKK